MAQALYVCVLSHVFSGERLQRKEEEEAEAGSVSFWEAAATLLIVTQTSIQPPFFFFLPLLNLRSGSRECWSDIPAVRGRKSSPVYQRSNPKRRTNRPHSGSPGNSDVSQTVGVQRANSRPGSNLQTSSEGRCPFDFCADAGGREAMLPNARSDGSKQALGFVLSLPRVWLTVAAWTPRDQNQGSVH